MKKWKIYFLILSLLSGSLLSSLFISRQEAYADSITLSSDKVEELISDTVRNVGYPYTSKSEFKIYHIYDSENKRNYAVVHTCSNYNSIWEKQADFANCGFSLKKRSSVRYGLDIRGSFAFYQIYDSSAYFSRLTHNNFNNLEYLGSDFWVELSNINADSEQNFNKNIKFNPVPEFVKKDFNYNSSSSSDSNNPFDLSGIVSGIVNGIKTLFDNFTTFISSSYEAITQAIGDFTSPMRKSLSEVEKYFNNDPLGKLGTSITDFFKGFPDMLSNFVKSLFIIEPDYITQKVDSFRLKMNQKLGTIGSVFSDMVYFMQVFTNKSASVHCNVNAVPVVENSIGIQFNLCKVPKTYILLARVLLYIALISIIVHRFIHFISILVGSRYIWSFGEKEKETD